MQNHRPPWWMFVIATGFLTYVVLLLYVLWALGVVTYEMLTGAKPFLGSNPAEIHGAVLAGRFTPVSVHLPEAPNRWQEFFARLLDLRPLRRPGSAGLFLADLERTLLAP